MSGKKKLIRQNFRDSVFRRDGNKCVLCGQTENLDVHHITDRNLMPFGGYKDHVESIKTTNFGEDIL